MNDPGYADFDLRIWREGDVFKAEVTHSPVGSSRQDVIKWPYPDDAEGRDRLREKLEAAVANGRGQKAGAASIAASQLREFGADVFSAVMERSATVSRTYRDSQQKVDKDPMLTGLRVKLHFPGDDADLAALPWEYMFDATGKLGGYVCLRDRTPITRFLGSPNSGVNVRTDGPLRILAMVANPLMPPRPPDTGPVTLNTAKERESIDAAWTELSRHKQVELRWVPGERLDDLTLMLLKGPWHIFHFIGHGGTEVREDEHGVLGAHAYVVMKDDAGGAARVDAKELAGRFERERRQLQLVMLNCCDSALGNLASAGAAFSHAGVPSVIAMQYAITNGASVRLAERFYQSLAHGDPVERALTEARNHVCQTSDVEWGIPVMFTHAGPSIEFDVASLVRGTTPTRPASATEQIAGQALRNMFTPTHALRA